MAGNTLDHESNNWVVSTKRCHVAPSRSKPIDAGMFGPFSERGLVEWGMVRLDGLSIGSLVLSGPLWIGGFGVIVVGCGDCHVRVRRSCAEGVGWRTADMDGGCGECS